MDALLPAFLAALFAEIGDKTQFLAVLLAARFPRHGGVLAGIAVAALANSLIAAAGGQLVHMLVNHRAIALMTALALLSAGAGSLWRGKPPRLEGKGRGGAFWASAFAFFVLEFGDKTQFLTMTLAARADSFWLAGIGAAAGIILASAPAVMLGAGLPKALPLVAMRIGAGLLFITIGTVVALGALRLI